MDDLSGKFIKGYELQERLGAGGFGAVYRAYQPTVGREVAVKIILPHFANQPEFIRRFESEAQLVARLEHPYIVPLYDYWRDPDGAYLVMRLLRGGSLRDALQGGPFDLSAAVLLIDQITAALTTAHRCHVIHRDLKPANVLLDEDGNAYLADFGIAKNLDNLQGSTTQADMVVGSPDYLSPEQARSESVSPQTDIYSLGVLLYEMLSGEHPFPNVTPIERMYMHLNDPLPRVTTIPAHLVDAVNAVIQRATAKDPANRYSDALALAVAFREAAALPRESALSDPVEILTQREQEVLQGILDGKSNKEIAEELFITITTVKWYVRQIYNKLHVRSRVQAIVRAREFNLITGDRTKDETSERFVNIDMQEQFAPENPYKGLRAFQAADTRDFFGREALTQKLVTRLDEKADLSRFLAVVGPSGSGKSSLVKAGLIPALWRGALPGSERWFVVELVPGTHPLDELEIALMRIAANQAENLKEQLWRDERGLLRIAQLILPNDGSELVLVIDQFEEVFTLVKDEASRAQFLNLIHAATTDPRSRVRVVLTLRADFYDRPLFYPKFGELLRSRMETLLPLSANELESAITRPAEQVGVTFEAGLVSSIVAEVNYQPGALPLLQYALTELFEHRQGNVLTQEAYQAIGRTIGALARQADEIYDGLDAEGQDAARQIFLRLVTPGEGVEDTRRRVSRSELTGIVADVDLIDELIDTFAAYRLLSLDNDPTTRSPTIELAHEAILREWSRLRSWLAESRDDLRLQRQLATSAGEWRDANQEPSFLLRGSRLSQFETWMVATKLALSAKERVFLDACIAEREHQAAAEQDRQARELTLARDAADSAKQAATSQRRAAINLRYLVAALGTFLLVAVGLLIFALNSRADALNQGRISADNATRSESLRLAAEANGVLGNSGSGELATLLAIRSLSVQYSPQGDAALQQAMTQNYAHQLFVGHKHRIWAAAYSHQGNYVLTGSFDKTARLWDVQTRTTVKVFSGHTDIILSVAFSPDDSYVLTGSRDKTVRLWDVQTGQEIRQFVGHTDAVFSLAFSPDGKSILTGSADKTVRVWDVQTGQEVHQFLGHLGIVRGVQFSTDGQSILTSSEDRTARLWDGSSGEEIRRFSNADPIFASAWSPNGKYILTGGGKVATLWDARTGAALHTFLGHTDFIFSAAFSPDGSYVATGGVDATARLWDTQTGQQLRLFAGHVGTVYGVAFSPDGKYVLTSSKDMTARLWEVQQTSRAGVFIGHSSSIYAVAYSPDGNYVVTGASDKTARLWAVETGREIRQLVGHTDVVSAVAWSSDGKFIITGSFDGTARLWNAQTGAELRTFTGHTGSIHSIVWSPDSKFILSGSADKTARLWDAGTGKELRQFLGHAGEVYSVAWSPDSKFILSGSADKTARLWDAATGKELRQFLGHTDWIQGVAFSPDGKTIVTGSEDKTARLWDLATGQELQVFKGHREWVRDVVFSPDGKYILTASYDKTARLWNVQTGQEIRRFAAFSGAVDAIAFSPNGQSVLAGSYDSTAQQTAIDYRSLITIACQRVLRDFTADERLQFGLEDQDPTCLRSNVSVIAQP